MWEDLDDVAYFPDRTNSKEAFSSQCCCESDPQITIGCVLGKLHPELADISIMFLHSMNKLLDVKTQFQKMCHTLDTYNKCVLMSQQGKW